jgi:hypothetical protein
MIQAQAADNRRLLYLGRERLNRKHAPGDFPEEKMLALNCDGGHVRADGTNRQSGDTRIDSMLATEQRVCFDTALTAGSA